MVMFYSSYLRLKMQHSIAIDYCAVKPMKFTTSDAVIVIMIEEEAKVDL